MKKYIKPNISKISSNLSEFCLNGESIVDELGIVQTTISDELLDEE